MPLARWGDDTETHDARPATLGRKMRAALAAKRMAHEALSEGTAKDGAKAFDVTPSRFSHWKTDGNNDPDPAARFYEAIMAHPSENAARAYVIGAESALERRRFLAGDTPILLTELYGLWEAEHQLDMGEDREGCLFMAGGTGSAYYAALRKHGTVQLRLAEVMDELEHRRVDVRKLLLERSLKHGKVSR